MTIEIASLRSDRTWMCRRRTECLFGARSWSPVRTTRAIDLLRVIYYQ